MKNFFAKIDNSYIFYLAALALAFCIPVYNAFTPMLISLLVILFLIGGQFMEKMSSLFTIHTFVFILIYLAYIIGLTYSSNMDYACRDLFLKLPLLLFPLLIFSSGNVFTETRISSVYKAFIIACAVATIVCLAHAAYNYSQSHDPSEFYYIKLTPFIHPSYFAMYLNFAVVSVASFLIRNKNEISKASFWWLTGLMLYFAAFIVLLSSKAGMLFLFISFLAGMVFLLQRKKYLVVIVTIAVSLLSLFILTKYFEGITKRVETAFSVVKNTDNIEKTTNEGTGERILIWKASLELIADNFWIGVGTGDVKDVLIAKYQESGISGPVIRKLNAHNQFLQTFLALGIFGFIALLALFVYPMILAMKYKKYVYVLFLLSVLINFLFESMLERQAGVMFFAFFNTLLFVDLKKNLK